MKTSDLNITVHESLKSIKLFRELVDHIREAECGLGSQSQSPDNSISLDKVRVLNSDYLSKTELVYLCLLCYYLNTRKSLRFSCPILLSELLTILPEKIQNTSYLCNAEKVVLWELLTRYKWYLDGEWPFSSRELKGIISDGQIVRKLRKRLYQKVRPRKVRRTERHRGYRDHGTLRPLHCWLPTEDYELTKLQNQIELERERCQAYYHLAISGKRPVPVEDFPTIFDKKR